MAVDISAIKKLQDLLPSREIVIKLLDRELNDATKPKTEVQSCWENDFAVVDFCERL